MNASFSISTPLLEIGTTMLSDKATIYHVRPTGWNNDYLVDALASVNTSLGIFTVLKTDRKFTIPVDHTPVMTIDLAKDKDTDLVHTIAQAVVELPHVHVDYSTAFEVAKQIIVMILPSAEDTPEPPTLWDDELS